MDAEFEGEVWYWKGPAPWYFVTVPPELCAEIKLLSNHVTYGWGMIPAHCRIGKTRWYTALWPRDGSYIVPLKVNVRRAEKIDEGDRITVHLSIG